MTERNNKNPSLREAAADCAVWTLLALLLCRVGALILPKVLLPAAAPLAFFAGISVAKRGKTSPPAWKTALSLSDILLFVGAALGFSAAARLVFLALSGGEASGSLLPGDAAGVLVFAVCSVFITPVAEEIFFRSVLLNRLLPFGRGLVLAAVTVIFAAFHPVEGWASALFCGALFGAAALATGSVALCVIMHAACNACSVAEAAVRASAFSPSEGVWAAVFCLVLAAGICCLGVLFKRGAFSDFTGGIT